MNNPHIIKKNIKQLYHLPDQVQYCRQCTVSNQRPRIVFNNEGICSACQFTEIKKTTNWPQRETELQQLLDKHRKGNGEYDVIVPASGGKDGSFVAHQLKEKYGMKPLTVTWAPHLPTDIGQTNLASFIDAGFDNIYGQPNGKVHRLLTKLSFVNIGDPFQPFIYGQTNFPLKTAVNYGISLIMYGENGEVEYGGDMKNANKATREISDHNKHYFSGIPPEAWSESGINAHDLHIYLPPDTTKLRKNNTEIHFFSYYKKWDPQENYYYCREHTGFQPNPERTQGTYSKYASLDDKLDGIHYYLSLIKFGIGRATSDSAHEIRDGKITREEGVALIKRYDQEFPNKYFQEFLNYCDIEESLFWHVIDSWRADHIWNKVNGHWQLRHPIWEQFHQENNLAKLAND